MSDELLVLANSLFVVELIQLVRSEEPVGGRQWDDIAVRYNDWAGRAKLPIREAGALKKKFFEGVNHTKPTGITAAMTHFSPRHQGILIALNGFATQSDCGGRSRPSIMLHS